MALVNSDLIGRLRIVYHSSVAIRACVYGSDSYVSRIGRSRAALQLEILALRHQIGVL